MTDPFYLDKSYYDAHPEAPAGEKKVYGSEGFSPEDITGADYIILNHVHGDHCNLVGMPDVPNELMAMGGIYNFNFMIVTKQNFKIDFSAGRDYEEHVRHVREEAPNILLRHRIRTYTPEEYAGQLEMMGAQYILPLHQTNARASDEDLNLYFQKVNRILEEKGCPARAFNPKPYQWFQVYTGIRSVQ